MDILITGGAGFVGSHLAERFLSDPSYSITIIDNLNGYYSPLQKEKNLELLLSLSKNDNLSIIKGDIRDLGLITQLFKKNNFNQIIHLAAMVGVRSSILDPDLYYDVNVQGTLNLLNACIENDVRTFIFASSSSVYGESRIFPFKENQKVDRPISPYAATKKAGEGLCYLYHHLYGINVTCLRFFLAYGPRGRPDMAPFKFMDSIHRGLTIKRYGDGKSRRDYTYISDIVNGIVLASEKDFPFEIFNLGRGQIVELNRFISLLEEIIGKKARIKTILKQDGDVPLTYADVTKAKKLLGYNPEYSIQKGLEKTYEWYLSSLGSNQITKNL